MFLKIGNLEVENANLLSCPYVLGLSVASIYGFLVNLEFQLNTKKGQSIEFNKFSIIVNRFEDKKRNNIIRDAAYSKNGEAAPMLPNRRFNCNIDIICEIELDNNELSIKEIENVILSSKLQGGEIVDVNVELFKTNIFKEVVSKSNRFSKILLYKQDELINSENLLNDISNSLLKQDYVLISNGYIFLEKANFKRLVSNTTNEDEDFYVNSEFVEPNLILAKFESIKDFLETEKNGFQFYLNETDNHYVLTSNNTI